MNSSFESGPRSVAKDEILFKEGSAAAKMFLVISGRILCLKRDKDRLIPVLSAGPQEIVGEEALFARTAQPFSAIMAESGEVVEVDLSQVDDVMLKSPKWIRDLMATLAERVVGTCDAIAEHRIVSEEYVEQNIFSDKEEVRLKKLLG
jgi:CRP-like cAMP-binding protein